MAWSRPLVTWTVGDLSRAFAAQRLAREVTEARGRGSAVLLFRPTAGEHRRYGANLMRRSGWEHIAQSAYDHAARALERPRFQEILGIARGAAA
jgi:hypothetical protein